MAPGARDSMRGSQSKMHSGPSLFSLPFPILFVREGEAQKKREFELTAPKYTSVPFPPDCILKVPEKSITSHGFTAKPKD